MFGGDRRNVGYLEGGLHRRFGLIVLAALAWISIASSLSILVFNLTHGLDLEALPWMVYTLFLLLPSHSTGFHDLLMYWLESMSSGAIICLIVYLWLMPQAHEKIFGTAHFATLKEVHAAGLFADEGIILGKAFGKTLRLSGFEGVLVNAPMGAGKTRSIAIPNLMRWKDSCVINDLKGELYAKTAKFRTTELHNQCFRFAPADVTQTTHRYNPFYYVSTNKLLRVRDLQLIAEILIPAERIDGGFWYTSSREIFVMLALFLFETEGMATLQKIHDLSKQEDFIAWLTFIVQQEKISDEIFYQNAYSLLNADEDKTQKNIIKDFHSRMMLFSDPLVRHATSGNDFDVRNLRKEKISIYINIPDSDKERLKPILTLFWAQTIDVLTQQEPNLKQEPYAVLALLDEFGNMARINKLKDGMSFFRSYRIRAIIIVQYFAQIYSVYGQHDSKGFLNAKVKIAFALNDMDDAEFFSKALGTKTVKTKSRNKPMSFSATESQSESYQARPLLSADEMMRLKSHELILILEGRSPVRAKKFLMKSVNK